MIKINSSIKEEVKNLCQFIFKDKDYNNIMQNLRKNNIAIIRLFIEDYIEKVSVDLVNNPNDTVLQNEMNMCRRLDSIITDLYIKHKNNIAVV